MSPGSSEKRIGFRPDIEGLRAVAILLVLAYHAGLPVSGGYVGVDVFFVISGFLISGLLVREVESTGSISLLAFYARRAKRLLPAACVTLVFAAGLTAWLAPATQRGVFGLDVVAAAAYFVNWRFAARSVDYLAQDVGRSYFDALDVVGKALGWRISTATKSACPFSDAMIMLRGKPYEACRKFNLALMAQLERDPPDAVITSQRFREAYPAGGKAKPREGPMIDGLVSHWSRMSAWGTRVVVLLDSPAADVEGNVYECLLEHPDAARRCAFPREKAIRASAAEVLLAAARRVPGTGVIDLTDFICPRASCAPVIGEVLVYRQGSHITNTYARTLAPVLARQLEQALTGEP